MSTPSTIQDPGARGLILQVFQDKFRLYIGCHLTVSLPLVCAAGATGLSFFLKRDIQPVDFKPLDKLSKGGAIAPA